MFKRKSRWQVLALAAGITVTLSLVFLPRGTSTHRSEEQRCLDACAVTYPIITIKKSYGTPETWYKKDSFKYEASNMPGPTVLGTTSRIVDTQKLLFDLLTGLSITVILFTMASLARRKSI